MNRTTRKITLTFSAIFGIGCIIAIIAAVYCCKPFDNSESVRIYVPRGATSDDLRDTLRRHLPVPYADRVFTIWQRFRTPAESTPGSYVINPGDYAIKVAKRIASHRQTPLKLTVNVARTLDDLVEAIASKVDATPDEILSAMDIEFGGDRPTYTARIIPDTYEVYFDEQPARIIDMLNNYYTKFWTDSRRAKAAAIGLTPLQAATLASIVEEESNRADEQPVIARLYLNRLEKGMKLQADPTVKFALGAFALRRITGRHLNIDSPYNTYKINGLPPGPIRLPQKAAIDAVLNAPPNNYLYMCAKEDFSGRHNFTDNYTEHLRNARRYADALNRRGIH